MTGRFRPGTDELLTHAMTVYFCTDARAHRYALGHAPLDGRAGSRERGHLGACMAEHAVWRGALEPSRALSVDWDHVATVFLLALAEERTRQDSRMQQMHAAFDAEFPELAPSSR